MVNTKNNIYNLFYALQDCGFEVSLHENESVLCVDNEYHYADFIDIVDKLNPKQNIQLIFHPSDGHPVYSFYKECPIRKEK